MTKQEELWNDDQGSHEHDVAQLASPPDGGLRQGGEVLDVPLGRGMRPMWGMRALLERMTRHHRLGLPGCAVSELEARNWALTLRLLAAYVGYTERNNTRPDMSTLIQACTYAPLVGNHDWALSWERDRPWAQAKFGVYEGQASAYADCMDERPSEAYLISSTTTPVWAAWLSQIPLGQLIVLFLDSARAWEDWLERRQHGSRSAVQLSDDIRSLDRLWSSVGTKLGLEADSAARWAVSELWWREPTSGQEAILMHVLQGVRHSLADWLALVGQALATPRTTRNGPGSAGMGRRTPDDLDRQVARIWGTRSPLRLGPITVLSDTSGAHNTLPEGTNWTTFQEAWSTHNWRWFRQRLAEAEVSGRWANEDQPLSEIVFSGVQHEIDWVDDRERTERWAHLDGLFERVHASLLGPRAVAILIVGENGSGKSTVARDLAACSNRTVITPQGRMAATSTATDKTEETPEKQLGRALTWVNVTTGPGGTAVVLDGLGVLDPSQLAGDLRRYFDDRRVALIFTTTNPSALPKDILGRFDLVVPLGGLPLPQRLALARRLFPTEELALRAARSLRSGRAIQQAASWCGACGDWSWAAVQSQQQGRERGQQDDATGDTYEEAVDLSGQETTPWVGYDHLQEVANRLCRGFENPSAYERLGGKVPRGAVLIGPPGTGKTLFARALARRLDVPLLAPSTAQMMAHPERVRAVMTQARRMAPCVLLLDEAAQLVTFGGKLTEALLAELDGADPLEGVLVIATLNYGVLHPAMSRPGRLHEVHVVDIPSAGDRLRIWQSYLGRLPCANRTEAWDNVLIRASRGFAGSDIAECVRRAGGEAAGAGEEAISLLRLTQACDAIAWVSPSGGTGGRDEDRWCTAVHESGHAFLAWRHHLEVLRVTVRPRGEALGLTSWRHEEEKMERTRQDWHGVVQMAMGGIAAEQAIFGSYGSGGSVDLEIAVSVLQRAVTSYGMGHLGPINGGSEFLWSDRRRRNVEDEVEAWARAAFDEASTWCAQHSDLLTGMAKELLAARDLSGSELDPWQQRVWALPDTRPEAPVWHEGQRRGNTEERGEEIRTVGFFDQQERIGEERTRRPTIHRDLLAGGLPSGEG